MATKHQPQATLPWKATRQHIFAQDGSDVATMAVPLTSLGSTLGDAAQNARYVAHACNAYPKLVILLKHVVEWREPAGYSGEQLLRELGEL